MIRYLTAVLYGYYDHTKADVTNVRRFLDGKPVGQIRRSRTGSKSGASILLDFIRESGATTMASIVGHLGVTEPTAIYSVNKLLKAKLVTRRLEGRKYIYEVA